MRKTLDGARLVLVWLLLASTGMPAFGATGKFVDRVFGDTDGNHKYVVFEPAGYAENAEKTWPVILFLHGAGERGDDGRAQNSSQLFMEVLIAELRGDEWKLTDDQVGNTFNSVVEVPFDLETLFRKVRGLE